MTPPSSVIASDAAVAQLGAPLVARPPAMRATTAPIARVRVLFVLGLVVTGVLWRHPSDGQTLVFYSWGLVWLPWSILLLVVSERTRRRLSTVVAVGVDVAGVLAALAIFPAAPGLFLVLLFLVLLASWLVGPELPRAWSSGAVVAGGAAVRFATVPAGAAASSSTAFAIMA